MTAGEVRQSVKSWLQSSPAPNDIEEQPLLHSPVTAALAADSASEDNNLHAVKQRFKAMNLPQPSTTVEGDLYDELGLSPAVRQRIEKDEFNNSFFRDMPTAVLACLRSPFVCCIVCIWALGV